jgi:hypothetical protein
MFLTAIVVFLGAAYNVEVREAAGEAETEVASPALRKIW